MPRCIFQPRIVTLPEVFTDEVGRTANAKDAVAPQVADNARDGARSEERRVGKECRL